jgi:hypothetical protein
MSTTALLDFFISTRFQHVDGLENSQYGPTLLRVLLESCILLSWFPKSRKLLFQQ